MQATQAISDQLWPHDLHGGLFKLHACPAQTDVFQMCRLTSSQCQACGDGQALARTSKVQSRQEHRFSWQQGWLCALCVELPGVDTRACEMIDEVRIDEVRIYLDVLVRVGPEQVAQEPLVWDICRPLHAPYLVQILQLGRQASMHAQDLRTAGRTQTAGSLWQQSDGKWSLL